MAKHDATLDAQVLHALVDEVTDNVWREMGGHLQRNLVDGYELVWNCVANSMLQLVRRPVAADRNTDELIDPRLAFLTGALWHVLAAHQIVSGPLPQELRSRLTEAVRRSLSSAAVA